MSPLALSLRFLQTQPDSRLVELAGEGHEAAFEALVRRYRKELLSYCRRLAPQGGSAEDVLQQALLQAWSALKAGAAVREVRPWLYRIAHNVAVSNLRVTVAVPREINETAGGVEVDQLVQQRLDARAALAGMASLPALQRRVMVCTALDGASHEEVASALGLSNGSVRGLIYRARATLRAAAAALTPSPAMGWAVRRAEFRPGGTSATVEMLAGGGGAGAAGLVVKGAAVLTAAGALAGGGVIVSHASGHGRGHRDHLVSASHASSPRGSGLVGAPRSGDAANAARRVSGHTAEDGLAVSGNNRGPHDSSPGGEDNGPSGASGGGGNDRSDGGSTGAPPGGSDSVSDSGSASGATIASSTSGSSGTSSGGSGGTSGSSDGQRGGSLGSGSDGGTSGATGSQVTTVEGSSGSDGGATASSDTSGSGDTTTTTTTSGSH